MVTATNRDLKGTVYELFILLLSILSIFNAVAVALSRIVGDAGPASQVILAVDSIIAPIFLADFLYRLKTADSRRDYFLYRYGWADLLGVLPLLRILRVVRVVRVLRSYRHQQPGRFVADLSASRALATFLVTLFLVIVVTEVAGATIYYAESGAAGSNIASASDAIWWALVTITTVGYGDRFPVTDQGRAIGVFLLFAGIGLFSVLTGFIANVFLSPHRRLRRSRRGGDDVRAAVDAARVLLIEQEERASAIRERLDELDRLLPREGDRSEGEERRPGTAA
jgi:voltage-gated potassium channel